MKIYIDDIELLVEDIDKYLQIYSRPETFAEAVQVFLALYKEATTTRAKEHARRS